jgi:hypothetical protein
LKNIEKGRQVEIKKDDILLIGYLQMTDDYEILVKKNDLIIIFVVLQFDIITCASLYVDNKLIYNYNG